MASDDDVFPELRRRKKCSRSFAAVYKGFYTEVWERETVEDEAKIDAFLANITAWNWGFTDP